MATFADISKILASRKGKYEKMSKSYIKAERNTANRMINRINQRMDALFDLQETLKAINPEQKPKPEMALGGVPPLFTRTQPGLHLKKMSNPFDIPLAPSFIDKPETLAESYGINTGLYKTPFSFTNISVKPKTKLGNNIDWEKAGEDVKVISPSLLEYAAQNYAISNMDAPEAPVYQTNVTLDKNLDTGASRNAVERIIRTRTLNAERNAPNSQALLSEYGRATSAGIEALNQINQDASNYRQQMANAEASINANINRMNTYLGNDYLQRTNEFNNNRTAARANAISDLITKIKLGFAENKAKKMDQKKLALILKAFPGNIGQSLLETLNG